MDMEHKQQTRTVLFSSCFSCSIPLSRKGGRKGATLNTKVQGIKKRENVRYLRMMKEKLINLMDRRKTQNGVKWQEGIRRGGKMPDMK